MSKDRLEKMHLPVLTFVSTTAKYNGCMPCNRCINCDSEIILKGEVKMELSSFGDEVNSFVCHEKSLYNTLPFLMQVMNVAIKQSQKNMDRFIKSDKAEIDFEDENTRRFSIKSDHLYEFSRLESELANSLIAYEVIPKSFIVSLVSQFDAYLGRLIQVMFCVKPELLNALEKSISFSQIVKYNSFEDVKKHIIEKEIESVLRKSHSEQFDWLENKLGMSLSKGLEAWPCFIEITERRNLFVHCNGVISSQYLNVCKENGINFDSIKVGNVLNVSPEYFKTAYQCVFEIGVKLAHVIWRKLKPDEMDYADKNLNNICYDLLVEEEYDLARKLLEFAIFTQKKYSSEENRLIFVINLAQTYKWNGETGRCSELLSSIDWSASNDSFKLASCVLLDNFDEAGQIMARIGANGDIGKKEYINWPLFKVFRKTEVFKNTYEKVFNSKFDFIDRDLTEQIYPHKEVIKEVATTKEELC